MSEQTRKRDEQFSHDVRDTYARRDRGELSDAQWLKQLERIHDGHLAACRAEYDRRDGGTR